MMTLTQQQFSAMIERWNAQQFKRKQAAEECRQQKVHKYAVTPLGSETSRVLVCTRCMKYVTEDKL